ncbi:MAG TPA: FecR/PupR family sigma factor regulator [Rhizomicrobium sp.]|nr:FecR/PupR family sigma factor regulator [Rhizomicrobium sp.]
MRRRLASSIAASEAAEWLARLRADDRSPADEAAFRAWLDADPGNAVAFDAVNAIWESVGALSRELRSEVIRSEQPKKVK